MAGLCRPTVSSGVLCPSYIASGVPCPSYIASGEKKIIISESPCFPQDGEVIPISVAVGDKVLVPEYGGTKLKFDEEVINAMECAYNT